MMFNEKLPLACSVRPAFAAGCDMGGVLNPATRVDVSLVNPTALMRTVQAEGRNGHVKALTRRGDDHMVGSDHESGRRFQGRSRRVLKALAWFKQRLLADNAGPVHVLDAAACVGDLPGSPQQLHGFGALVLDLHAIRPYVVVVLGR